MHDHDHHHRHLHGPNCTCGCCQEHHHHHEEALSIPDGAVMLSVKQTFSVSIRPSELERMASALFQAIAEQVAFEDIIPGHIKGAVQCEEGLLSLSMTRLDLVDTAKNQAWEQLESLQDWAITVNVLSVMPTQLDERALAHMIHHAFHN